VIVLRDPQDRKVNPVNQFLRLSVNKQHTLVHLAIPVYQARREIKEHPADLESLDKMVNKVLEVKQEKRVCPVSLVHV
jgi:hypothetical protein